MMEQERKRVKQIYDTKRVNHVCHPGDLVLLYNPAVPQTENKKYRKRRTGPFTVLIKLSDLNYEIDVQGSTACPILNIQRLKPYKNAWQERAEEYGLDEVETLKEVIIIYNKFLEHNNETSKL